MDSNIYVYAYAQSWPDLFVTRARRRRRFEHVERGRGSSSGFSTASRSALLQRVGGIGAGERGFTPRRSRSARHERGGQRGEEIGLGTSGREGQADAAGRFDDAGGDLDELEAQRGELRLGQIARFGNGVAHG